MREFIFFIFLVTSILIFANCNSSPKNNHHDFQKDSVGQVINLDDLLNKIQKATHYSEDPLKFKIEYLITKSTNLKVRRDINNNETKETTTVYRLVSYKDFKFLRLVEKKDTVGGEKSFYLSTYSLNDSNWIAVINPDLAKPSVIDNPTPDNLLNEYYNFPSYEKIFTNRKEVKYLNEDEQEANHIIQIGKVKHFINKNSYLVTKSMIKDNTITYYLNYAYKEFDGDSIRIPYREETIRTESAYVFQMISTIKRLTSPDQPLDSSLFVKPKPEELSNRIDLILNYYDESNK